MVLVNLAVFSLLGPSGRARACTLSFVGQVMVSGSSHPGTNASLRHVRVAWHRRCGATRASNDPSADGSVCHWTWSYWEHGVRGTRYWADGDRGEGISLGKNINLPSWLGCERK